MRFGRSSAAVDSSGLPYERVLCIDEDGRDRTPKPFVAARPHGVSDTLPHSWGGSDGLTAGAGCSDSNSDHASFLSFAPLLGGSGLPTARSFLAGSDAAEPSREASLDGSAMPMGREGGISGRPSVLARGGAGTTLNEYTAATATERHGGAGSQGTPLSVALQDVCRLEQGQRGSPSRQQHSRQGAGSRQEQVRKQGERSKATQCQAAARSSRGIQVLPWELHQAGSAPDDEPTKGEVEGDIGAPGELEDDEEALLALHYPGGSHAGGHAGGYRQSERDSPTLSHAGGMLSAAASRHGSMTGGSRAGSFSQRSSMMGEPRGTNRLAGTLLVAPVDAGGGRSVAWAAGKAHLHVVNGFREALVRPQTTCFPMCHTLQAVAVSP